MTWRVDQGDAVELMAAMPEASVDAIVTDPPYALEGGFMGKAWDRFDGREDVAFGYWLAGFIDGEGCFRVQRHERGSHTCTFTLQIRRDDRAVLDQARRALGIGQVNESESSGSSPMVRWAVQDKAGCDALVGFLRRFPLRAKKRIDFETWAEAVGEWLGRPRGNRWAGPSDQAPAAALKARIERGRLYAEPAWSGHPFQDWTREWAREALRVLKPGGHLLAFGGTRTVHRLAAGIEDAGFEIRDTIAWMYGSGFPKSLDVSKAIDKVAGVERPSRNGSGDHAGTVDFGMRNRCEDCGKSYFSADPCRCPRADLAGITAEAQQWEGWGTALKPAHEPIVVARKPLVGTVAGNVTTFGTGALNIDGCRIGTDERRDSAQRENGPWASERTMEGGGCRPNGFSRGRPPGPTSYEGRWPANVVMDEDAAAMLDEQTGELAGGGFPARRGADGERQAYGAFRGQDDLEARKMESGGASRFFYCSKTSSAERNAGLDGFEAREHHVTQRREVLVCVCGNRTLRDTWPRCPKCGTDMREGTRTERTGLAARNVHPTVKPIDLMRWLVRLVCPPGGTILDPFTGSGSTGAAAVLEGFDFIGLEREQDYVDIARARIAWWARRPGVDTDAALAAVGAEDSVRATGQGSLFDEAA